MASVGTLASYDPLDLSRSSELIVVSRPGLTASSTAGLAPFFPDCYDFRCAVPGDRFLKIALRQRLCNE